jgi:hypothetical protein
MTSHLPQRRALKRQFLWIPVKKVIARLLKQRWFQRHGNEQRCQIQHLANGEETAVSVVLAWACGTVMEER